MVLCSRGADRDEKGSGSALFDQTKPAMSDSVKRPVGTALSRLKSGSLSRLRRTNALIPMRHSQQRLGSKTKYFSKKIYFSIFGDLTKQKNIYIYWRQNCYNLFFSTKKRAF